MKPKEDIEWQQEAKFRKIISILKCSKENLTRNKVALRAKKYHMNFEIIKILEIQRTFTLVKIMHS